MNSDPDEPMDSQLLQLERELFSLTPVETPRRLGARLDRQVMAPVCIGRQQAATSHQPKIIAFQWRRMVVPAAAAVVVVSVLNHLESPGSRHPALAQSKPGLRDQATNRTAAAKANAGYVLRSEPVLLNPTGWRNNQPRIYIQQGTGAGPRSFSTPQRSAVVAPVVFH